jgi:hypothetical protein
MPLALKLLTTVATVADPFFGRLSPEVREEIVVWEKMLSSIEVISSSISREGTDTSGYEEERVSLIHDEERENCLHRHYQIFHLLWPNEYDFQRL